MQVDLGGKIAIVTGAGGFIGGGISEELARQGATVIVQDYNVEAAQKCTERILTAGGRAEAFAGDLREPGNVEEMAAAVYAKHGKIDILVNNAGINSPSEHRVTIDSFDDDMWQAIVSIDLNGLYLCSKHVSKYMVRQRSGRIINISSVAGVVALRKQCAFVAAKSGVLGLTRAMAAELGQYNILVNAVAPGSITNAVWSPNQNDSLLSHIPLGRQGYDSEVAAAVAFLAAPEASYITGAMLTVDGGWTCGFMRDW